MFKYLKCSLSLKMDTPNKTLLSPTLNNAQTLYQLFKALASKGLHSNANGSRYSIKRFCDMKFL